MTMKNELPCIEGGKPVRSTFLPFAPPLIGEEEVNEVVDTLRSGWITTGPKVEKFEKQFAEYINAKYTVALSSCTAGLFLSLLAFKLKEGEEVITTPYTFAATSNVILHCKAKPVFVDICPDTLNINTEKIEEKITNKTRGIIPVHIAGRPCDMDRIVDITKRHNLWIVEDAAHAVGTIYKKRYIGTIGDITSFSFHAVKNMTTAEGGLVATDNKKWADFIKIVSLHGMNKDAWHRKDSWFYEIVYPGHKYNMTDIQASIGIHQLRKLEGFIKKRQSYARIYDENLSPLDEIEILSPCEYGRNTYHLYIIKLKLERLRLTRNEFIQALLVENISANVHYIPVHYHPYYKNRFGYRPGDYPVAEDTYRRVVSLPIYPKMSEDDVWDVITAIKKIVKYYKK